MCEHFRDYVVEENVVQWDQMSRNLVVDEVSPTDATICALWASCCGQNDAKCATMGSGAMSDASGVFCMGYTVAPTPAADMETPHSMSKFSTRPSEHAVPMPAGRACAKSFQSFGSEEDESWKGRVERRQKRHDSLKGNNRHLDENRREYASMRPKGDEKSETDPTEEEVTDLTRFLELSMDAAQKDVEAKKQRRQQKLEALQSKNTLRHTRSFTGEVDGSRRGSLVSQLSLHFQGRGGSSCNSPTRRPWRSEGEDFPADVAKPERRRSM